MDLNKFLHDMALAATAAGHIWPEYAACEAALETGWGQSKLYQQAHNIFGEKALMLDTTALSIDTREYMGGGVWLTVPARWKIYASDAECFRDRMATLNRLAPKYPEYKAALAATDGDNFIDWVSRKWSTDPERATKVLNIHLHHQQAFMEEAWTSTAH